MACGVNRIMRANRFSELSAALIVVTQKRTVADIKRRTYKEIKGVCLVALRCFVLLLDFALISEWINAHSELKAVCDAFGSGFRLFGLRTCK